jgi:hypothetical protein
MIQNRKLGKHPVRHDPRTLKLAKYFTAAIPPPPSTCDWIKGKGNFGMMLNDQLGDCAIAAPGHQEQIWTMNASTELTLPDNAILKAYEAVSGYKPGDPNTDNGCNMLDVLKYWRKTGIGARKIQAFAAVDLKMPIHLSQAIYLFGGAYVGLQLPLSAQNQKVWKYVGDQAGGWGGHAVEIVRYDLDYLTCITWGKPLKMTHEFFINYADEAYAVLSNDWIEKNKLAPNHFNLSQLQTDLAGVA